MIAQVKAILYNEDMTPEDKKDTVLGIFSDLKYDSDLIYPILDPQFWQRNHQTLVVVEVQRNANSTWVERAVRMVTSLNTSSTIKADILSTADGVLYDGLIWTGVRPGVQPQKIYAQAEEWGYNQTFIHSYTGPK